MFQVTSTSARENIRDDKDKHSLARDKSEGKIGNGNSRIAEKQQDDLERIAKMFQVTSEIPNKKEEFERSRIRAECWV